MLRAPGVPVHHRALASMAVVACIVGVAGCAASTAKVDTAPIIQPVTSQLNEVGIKVSAFDCPVDIDRAAGSTFRCTAITDQGDKIGVTVTQKDEGGQLKLSWEIGNDLVVTQRFLHDLTSYANTVSADLSVRCPKAVVVAGGAGKLTCDVTDSRGQSGRLIVPLKDGLPVPDKNQWSIQQQ